MLTCLSLDISKSNSSTEATSQNITWSPSLSVFGKANYNEHFKPCTSKYV